MDTLLKVQRLIYLTIINANIFIDFLITLLLRYGMIKNGPTSINAHFFFKYLQNLYTKKKEQQIAKCKLQRTH